MSPAFTRYTEWEIKPDQPSPLDLLVEKIAADGTLPKTVVPSVVPVHTVLANDTLALALGTNTSVRLTVTAARTLTTTVPVAGSTRVVLILTAGSSSFVVTFGSGFKSVGTLATGSTAARVFAISFISDGTVLYETARTVAMVA